jgi:transposase
MRKLEIADPEIMRIAIQQEILRSDESRYDHRLHGLLLLTSGKSCQQIADLFGEDRRTVQRWVKRFEEEGLEGMRDGERPGRPACLDAKQWEAVLRLRERMTLQKISAPCICATCVSVPLTWQKTWKKLQSYYSTAARYWPQNTTGRKPLSSKQCDK